MKKTALVLLYIAATAGLTYFFAPFVGGILYRPLPVKALDWASGALGLHGMESFVNLHATVAFAVSLLLAMFAMRYVRRIAHLLYLLWKYRSR
ncbi:MULTISPECIES: hypothetical protein [Pseudomonas]|uniref:hypothetical protein n=1 Tax=Pseudomonas TaxID=286 RepID=UPI000D700A71|nr:MULTISPECIES: hypothetical protein [unclassified Pseudomonas]MED5611066.1 hypothetical protein [Pseudomonas sp. JH-2]PWU26527.1 hypothetical protein DK254_28605 [Pseudomonas sp. RW407]